MKQNEVIERIKELGARVLPEGASLWLYGSRARGDAREDSDYDLLILLDKDKITSEDHDLYGYPMFDLGLDVGAEINAHIYPLKKWLTWDFVPFHDNVEEDKVVLR